MKKMPFILLLEIGLGGRHGARGGGAPLPGGWLAVRRLVASSWGIRVGEGECVLSCPVLQKSRWPGSPAPALRCLSQRGLVCGESKGEICGENKENIVFNCVCAVSSPFLSPPRFPFIEGYCVTWGVTGEFVLFCNNWARFGPLMA